MPAAPAPRGQADGISFRPFLFWFLANAFIALLPCCLSGGVQASSGQGCSRSKTRTILRQVVHAISASTATKADLLVLPC